MGCSSTIPKFISKLIDKFSSIFEGYILFLKTPSYCIFKPCITPSLSVKTSINDMNFLLLFAMFVEYLKQISGDSPLEEFSFIKISFNNL